MREGADPDLGVENPWRNSYILFRHESENRDLHAVPNWTNGVKAR